MPARKPIAGLLLGSLLAVAVSADAQEVVPRVGPESVGLAAQPLAAITETLNQVVADARLAGAVVGVARHGQVAYLEAVGLQDLATRAPMTERSLFRVYSMTKAVTAVAVMMLHEEGRFQLSDPASMYLPVFRDVRVLNADGTTRPPARPITVEHLLLHTAGLSHRTSAEYREAGVRARDMSLDQLIGNMVRVPLRFDPGEGYLYSESSSVLGRLVEIWSRQPFDVFLRERIFEPLGMIDTGFWVEPERQVRLTTVYAPSDAGLRSTEMEAIPFTVRPTLLEGAVGLVSTVPDFLRFTSMLANRGELAGVRLLEESTVATITRNGLSDDILRTRRGGTGWAVANVSVVVDEEAAGGGARAGEYRWDGSAGTELWVDPASGTVLVTMWQSSPANPEQLRQRITALVREAVQP